MNKYISLLIVGLLPLMLCSCTTIAKRYELKDGAMVEVEKMELKGLGNREATFSDKSKIKCNASTLLPDIDLDIDKLKD